MSHEDECPRNIRVILAGRIVTGCGDCIVAHRQQGSAASYNRRFQQREHARDTIQPNSPREFAHEYPKEAREFGYTEAQMRKYG